MRVTARSRGSLSSGMSGEAGVAMFANKTRILLTFREDVLGRARVFPGLKLAEHQMLFANACRSASGSGEIRSGGEWRPGGVLAERVDERREETFCG
jgi:hypothetical protein